MPMAVSADMGVSRGAFESVVGLHQFAGVGLGGEEGQFAAQDGGGGEYGEPSRVLAGGPVLAAAEPGEVGVDETESLAVADRAEDQVGKGAGEVEVPVAVLGVGDALGALHDVR